MIHADDEPAYAGFWIRVGAVLLDTFLLFALVTYPAAMLFGSPVVDNPELAMRSLRIAQGSLFPLVLTLWLWRIRGATPGKMLLGLKIVDSTTLGPLTLGQAIARYLGYFLSLLTLGAGFLWVAIDRKSQGFHDKLSGTLVIHTRRTPPPNAASAPP